MYLQRTGKLLEKKAEKGDVIWLDEVEMEEVQSKLESPGTSWTVKEVESKVG